MPTLRVRELYDGRDASRSDTSRDFVRVWSVEQLDAGQPVSMGQVLDANGIPKVGDPYIGATVAENDLGVACKRVRARHNRSNKLWLVEAQYASANWGTTLPSEGKSTTGEGGTEGGEQLPPGFGGGETGEGTPSANPVQIDNPLLRPAVVRYYTVRRSEILTHDKDDLVIQNSVYQPFDPPLETERGRLGMTVTQNRALFDPTVIEEFHWSINSVRWAGGAAKSWRCEDINAERAFEEGIFYWKVSFTFVRNRQLWNPVKVLDIGTYYLSAGKRMDFYSATGQRLPRGLLDGSGGRNIYNADPHYKDVNAHKEKDFNALALFL